MNEGDRTYGIGQKQPKGRNGEISKIVIWYVEIFGKVDNLGSQRIITTRGINRVSHETESTESTRKRHKIR